MLLPWYVPLSLVRVCHEPHSGAHKQRREEKTGISPTTKRICPRRWLLPSIYTPTPGITLARMSFFLWLIARGKEKGKLGCNLEGKRFCWQIGKARGASGRSWTSALLNASLVKILLLTCGTLLHEWERKLNIYFKKSLSSILSSSELSCHQPGGKERRVGLSLSFFFSIRRWLSCHWKWALAWLLITMMQGGSKRTLASKACLKISQSVLA